MLAAKMNTSLGTNASVGTDMLELLMFVDNVPHKQYIMNCLDVASV